MSSLLLFLRQRFALWKETRALLLQHADRGLRIGQGVEVRSPDRLTVGQDVFIDAGVVLHCGGMDWSPGGGITIGDRSYVGPHAVLFGAGEIHIGADVLISPGVVITSHQHTFVKKDEPIRAQPLDFGLVRIDDDVWIGANAVVLPGLHLGKGSVVGAGAVVTANLPAGAVALGVPARVVRER